MAVRYGRLLVTASERGSLETIQPLDFANVSSLQTSTLLFQNFKHCISGAGNYTIHMALNALGLESERKNELEVILAPISRPPLGYLKSKMFGAPVND